MLNHFIAKIIFLNIIFSICIAARGDIISLEILSTRDVNNNQIYIDNELSVLSSDDFFDLNVGYGYWMYKIIYETIDKHGNPINASGVIAFPRTDWPVEKNEAYPILSYQHGTVIQKNSVTSESGIWVLPALIAGYGYVYLEPDYLGLGVSEGLHPYQIKDPYGTDVVDLLRAADNFSNENNNFQINSQIFLAGYSEGGYATMAAHQIIEQDHSDEFTITSSFPMAGAYDMSGIMTEVMLDYTPYGQPYYFPYVLFAYCDSYQEILPPVTDYLTSEYVEILPELFDGMHSGDDINNVMPNIPITIMKPDTIISFEQNLNHPLRNVLRQNDLYDWTPQSSMHIIHGLADELIPFENAQLAYDTFISNGANEINLISIPETFGGHQDAAPICLLGAFDLAENMKIINSAGDFNEDSLVDILDILGIVNAMFSNQYSNYQIWAANFNQDSNIDVLDIISLVNNILDN